MGWQAEWRGAFPSQTAHTTKYNLTHLVCYRYKTESWAKKSKKPDDKLTKECTQNAYLCIYNTV
jgi:hypothetical protein